MLAWNPEEGKVGFEFEPRESKYPARKAAAKKTPFGKAPKPQNPLNYLVNLKCGSY